MISQILLLLQKDLRELTRDRGFLFFAGLWCFIAVSTQIHLPGSALVLHPNREDKTVEARAKGIAEETTSVSEVDSSTSTADTATDKDDSDDSTSIANSFKKPLKIAIVGKSDRIKQLLASDHNVEITSLKDLAPKDAIDKQIVEAVLVLPRELENLSEKAGENDFSAGAHLRKTPEIKILTNGVLPDRSAFRATMALGKVKAVIVEERLSSLNLSNPWWQRQVTVEDPPKEGKWGYGRPDAANSMPFLITFALSLVTTVFSIEVICSENVRGTLALLIAAPINRFAILAAKTFLVSLTAYISLASAMSMAKHSLQEAKTTGPIDAGSGVLMLAVPLVFIIASWSVFMALRYRTRGTAMARLIPGAITAMTLAGIPVLPGVHFSLDIALIPIANMTGAVREFLSGRQDWMTTSIAVASCLLYGVLCMKQASNMLGDYGDLNSGARSRTPLAGNGFQTAVVLLVVTLITNFYVSRQLIVCNAVSGLYLSAVLLAVLAVTALFMTRRFQVLKLFRLKDFPIRATLCAAGLALVAVAIAKLTNNMHVMNPFRDIVAWRGTSSGFAFVVFFSLLLTVSQEVLFRAVFQELLKPTFSRVTLPLAIGLLSGICQPDSSTFLAACALGVVLSTTTSMSKSIYPSIVLHVLASLLAIAPFGFLAGTK